MLVAEFINLPSNPTLRGRFRHRRAGRCKNICPGRADEVYLGYTDYINTLRQEPRIRPLLALAPERRRCAR